MARASLSSFNFRLNYLDFCRCVAFKDRIVSKNFVKSRVTAQYRRVQRKSPCEQLLYQNSQSTMSLHEHQPYLSLSRSTRRVNRNNLLDREMLFLCSSFPFGWRANDVPLQGTLLHRFGNNSFIIVGKSLP
jgi:hypothetical protein